MQFPVWVKPGVYGAFLGAAGAMIVGFSFGGWVTGGTARQLASVEASESVTSALTPICVDMSARDPQLAERLAALKAASSYRRAEMVADNGWATPPGSTGPDRRLATACADQLVTG